MLTPYRPIPLNRLMNRLFDEAFTDMGTESFRYALPVDVAAQDDAFIVTASVAGLDPQNLEVEVLGDTLTIRGETPAPQAQDRTSWLLQERRYGKFERVLTMPVELDGAHAEAAVENGVLSLRIPKAETSRPKQIKIKTK